MTVWIGGIFLKDEGGYEIVSRSLAHYKKRLRTINESQSFLEDILTSNWEEPTEKLLKIL